MATRTYKIENMKCMGCVATVKSTIEELDGCEQAEVDLAQGMATVHSEVDEAALRTALEAVKFPATPLP